MRSLVATALIASSPPVFADPGVVEKAHAEYIYQIDFSSDGTRMATAAGDNAAIVWDFPGRKKLHVLEDESAVYGAVLSPDGKTLATGNADGFVTLWDAQTGKQIKRAKLHANSVFTLTFSPKGDLLASAGGDSGGGDTVCRLLSVPDLQVVKELAGHERQVYGLAFSPDGKSLATSSSDKTIRLWDLETGKAKIWKGHTSDVYRGAFSPDGKQFASPSQDGTIRLWSVEKREVIQTYAPKAKDPFYTVAFSSDGKSLAAVGDDRSLHLLDLPELSARWTKELSKYPLYALAFHPVTMAPNVAGEDGNLYLFSKSP
jgi:WD40 repeat protein